MEPAGQSPAPADAALTEAMDNLWRRFLPEIKERVAVIESAAAALTSRLLADEEREAAHAAAHKLAGVLGTFGLARGTELSREAEMLLAQEAIAARDATRMHILAAEIAELIKMRGSTRS